MKKEYVFGNVVIRFPNNWCIEKNSNPITLTKCKDGFGALQFSQAEFKSGKHPQISSNDLIEMVNLLGENNGMRKSQEGFFQNDDILLANAEFRWKRDFVKAWYLSNGKDILLITYTCNWIYKDKEKDDFSAIIENLEFVK